MHNSHSIYAPMLLWHGPAFLVQQKCCRNSRPQAKVANMKSFAGQLTLLAGLLTASNALYLPGVQPSEYQQGDQVCRSAGHESVAAPNFRKRRSS